MRGKFHYAAGLDVGSCQVRCVLLAVEEGFQRFLAAAAADSRGWNRSRISDADAVAEVIREVIQQTESRAGVRIESAVTGIGGPGVNGVNNYGLYECGRPRQVSADDLSYAIELASRVCLESDRMLLQVLPQDFTVDGRAGYRNPRGAQCSRLEANVHLVTAPAQEHQLVVAAVQKAGVAVEETIFESFAAAYAAVLPQERERAAAVVDVGMSSTGIAVYKGDALLLTRCLPVSADHFTRDLQFGLRECYGLRVSYDDAERLKVEFGCALLGLSSDNVMVEIPGGSPDRPQELSRRDLNCILEARAHELFLMVRSELESARLLQHLVEGEGVFLTGGGARLYGMWEKAEQVLGCPVRHGFAVGIEDWPQQFRDPAWTTAAGLAMYSARLKLQEELRRKPPGFLSLVLR